VAGGWFETVAEAQRRAKRRLPKGVYGALVAGSERGTTVEDNTAAFAELGFAPHTAGLANDKQMTTTVMGQEVSMPVLVSPTGVQAVHPDGEVAVARAAAAQDVAMGLSSFASKSVEEVGAAHQKLFFQMYWVGDRETILARAERARAAGAKGLIMTLDWSFASRRDWGSPPIPEKIDVRNALKFAPEVVRKPRWLARSRRTSSAPTASGWAPRCPPGRTSPGCASSGAGRSCSRGSPGPTTPAARSTPASPPSRSPPTAATTSTARPGRSARCPGWSTRSAARSRCSWTAGCAAVPTSSRRWPWAPRR